MFSGANCAWSTFTFNKPPTPDTLSLNRVPSILQAADGAIWFGTYENGVSRLAPDGTWQTFTQESTPGFADNRIRTLIQAKDGSIWVGATGIGGGACRMGLDGNWKNFTNKIRQHVWSILQTADGAIWFGTPDGGVIRLGTNGDCRTFKTSDGLATNSVYSMMESADGALWLASPKLSRLEPQGLSKGAKFKSVTRESTNGGLASDLISCMLQSKDGSLWFGARDSGVSRLTPLELGINGTWQTFTDESTNGGLGGNDIRCMMQTADGSLWFGTAYNGVSRLSPTGTWTNITSESTNGGLASNFIDAMLEARDGALWFSADDGGVCRYDRTLDHQ